MRYLKYSEFISEANISSVINRIGKQEDVQIEGFDDYVNHFLSIGATRLSGGSSAEILEFKGEIIKIFAPINDPGMTRFISFCESNATNPFVPKIKKITKSWASEESRWIFAVFMENLNPCKKDFENGLNGLLLDDDFQIDFKFGKNKTQDNKFFAKLKTLVMSYSNKSTEKYLDPVLNFLQVAIDKYKYMVDFGPQNWMMRGNQLVLIDPFWPDME